MRTKWWYLYGSLGIKEEKQMSLLQAYLRAGGTPEELHAKYAIKCKKHGKYPNLLLFKYDQLESPFAEPLVRECRGIILDSEDNWRIVCRPFSKFFNAQESLAAPIDWS